MTKEEARAQFAEVVVRDENELELDRAALLIAAEEYPHLDIELYLAQLDAFGENARIRDDTAAAPRERILRLNELVFDELGFRGNVESYFDVRNSFLNDVLDRRTGIPITLSVVYLEIARRIGLSLYGVGAPGHFLIKYADDEEQILIDPFNGGKLLTKEQCREMIERMYQGKVRFHSSFLYAVSKQQILTRMLQNLKGIYVRVKDFHKTLGLIERVLLLTPTAVTEIRDRGLIYAGMKRYAAALTDLEEYLRRIPHAPDAREINERISLLRQQQARLN